jgi:hypothetical protein
MVCQCLPTCVWHKYALQDCLQSKLGLKIQKLDIMNKSNEKENKIWIPYQHKFGERV